MRPEVVYRESPGEGSDIPEMPESLPWIIWYQVGQVLLASLPRREVRSIGSSGCTDAVIVRPWIPAGATGWRADQHSPFRPMSELPAEWMPWLDRQGRMSV